MPQPGNLVYQDNRLAVIYLLVQANKSLKPIRRNVIRTIGLRGKLNGKSSKF